MSEDDLWLEFERWRELADWHRDETGRMDLAEDAMATMVKPAALTTGFASRDC